MADETNETGANVSESTDSAELFLEKHPGTSVQIISNLLKVRDRLEEQLRTTRATLENKILHQADQLRLQQRALVRRAKTIKRQRYFIAHLDRVVEEARDYYNAHSDEYSSSNFELALDMLADIRPPKSTKETPDGR